MDCTAFLCHSSPLSLQPGSDSGCTAVVALLHGRQLYVANIGDSRCVLSRSGRAVDMSDDHKPEDEPELQRIVKAGGKVTMDGRVNGGLNLSRAFGELWVSSSITVSECRVLLYVVKEGNWVSKNGSCSCRNICRFIGENPHQYMHSHLHGW